MVPTPTMPGATPDERVYRGLGNQLLRKLENQLALGKLNSGSMKWTLNNGVEIVASICFNKYDIFVKIPPVVVGTVEVEREEFVPSFICNPRKLGVNDGYIYQGGILVPHGDGSIEYPLSIPATTQAMCITDVDIEIKREPLLYGNIDWKGWKNEVLTWYGPTGRSVPYNFDVYIEGLSVPDIVFSEFAAEKWTCFRSGIYMSGDVLVTAPSSIVYLDEKGKTKPCSADVEPKVLGAALSYVGGTRYIVAIVNNHYSQRIGFFEEVWAGKGESGLYDEINNPGGWFMLSSRFSGRPTSIWAFNKSGTEATQGLGKYVLDIATKKAEFSQALNTDIKCEWNIGPDFHSAVYSGSTYLWSDYKDDERVFSTIQASGGRHFAATTSVIADVVNAPVYLLGARYGQLWIEPPATPYSGYSLNGDGDRCCTEPVEWSFSKGTINNSGYITSYSGCGVGVVSASKCGVSASITVLMPSGVWVLESSCGSTALSGHTHEKTDGDTKILEWIAAGCGGGMVKSYTTVDAWDGYQSCYKLDVPTELWNGPSPCGAPQTDYVLPSDLGSECGSTNSTDFYPCSGTYPSIVVGEKTNLRISLVTWVNVYRREIYKYVCP